MARFRSTNPLDVLRWLPVFAIFLFAACGSPKPAALVFNPAPWQDGEQHVLAITDREGKPAGQLEFSISAGVNDQDEPLWVIQRTITSGGNQESITVKIDEKGFRPRASYLERTDANSVESVDAQYNNGQVDLTLNTKQNVMTVQRAQIPSDARETVTLPILVRALPLTRNYATQINAYLPLANQLERITVRVDGEETLTTPAGAIKSWVVVLDSGDAKSKAWVAQDSPHQLLKYVEGRTQTTFDLQTYQAGP
ncbi:MAG: DUF3108 domain-containing protein [Anaerolineales bacterium]|nr:DUF3108 domain-containing protein [Anaerolineales bacterium]